MPTPGTVAMASRFFNASVHSSMMMYHRSPYRLSGHGSVRSKYKDDKKILVCTVGSTVLHYDARCINDLQAMLKKAGDQMELGGADK